MDRRRSGYNLKENIYKLNAVASEIIGGVEEIDLCTL